MEFARVEDSEAAKWAIDTANGESVKLDSDAARELVDSLGGDMMMVANELEKLILFVGDKKRITLGDVETMVLAAKQRSFYELTDAISARDRARAKVDRDELARLDGLYDDQFRKAFPDGRPAAAPVPVPNDDDETF